MEGTTGAGPHVLQLRPTAHRVLAGDRLLLAHNGRRVVIAPYGDLESWLVRLLAEGTEDAALSLLLSRQWGAGAARRARDLVSELVTADLVRELAPEPAGPERFTRTLTYLSQFADSTVTEHDLMARIRASVIVVAGVGGLGSWICVGLAGLGVGEIRLVDMDTVEESNLNRSLLLREADSGRSKVDAFQERLRALTSQTEIRGYSHDLASAGLPAPVLDGADIVISTADKPAWVIRRFVAAACVDRGIHFICPSGFRVGPFYLGPGTACVMCEHAEMLDRQPGLESVFAGQQRVPASQPGSVPHVAAAAAAVTLQDTLRAISRAGEPATRNHVWTADHNLAATLAPRPPYPGCPACGPDREAPSATESGPAPAAAR